jgi:hypothetical protein
MRTGKWMPLAKVLHPIVECGINGTATVFVG